MNDERSGDSQRAHQQRAKVAERRSLGWRTLALAYYEPTEEWIAALLDGVVAAALSESTRWQALDRERFGPGLEMLTEFVARQQGRHPQDVLRDLKVEYAHLFIGAAGPMKAPPYESVWRDKDPVFGVPIVLGASATAVESFYRRCGIRMASSHRDLPDHVATELEFMYFLSCKEQEAWESGDVEAAKGLRRGQREFMEEHLARWLPDFCGRVESAAEICLYAALACILRQFLAVETGTARAQGAPREAFGGGGR